MTAIKKPTPFKIILICLLIFWGNHILGQISMPEVLDTGTMKEQYDYLEERTRIYNNFRTIREDMFQRIKSNSDDSLSAEKNNVLQLEDQLQDQGSLIDSLQSELQSNNGKLDQAIKNRDSLIFLGIPLHKTFYNTLLWIIIAALALLVGILFLSTKKLLSKAKHNKKDLVETKEEFEAYRKQARERNEQLVVKHHNEMKKMKGG
ncbi:hypothetical protein ES705_18616 [subsurface metagenome]